MKWKEILREQAKGLDPSAWTTIDSQRRFNGEIPVEYDEIHVGGFDYAEAVSCPICDTSTETTRYFEDFPCSNCGLIFTTKKCGLFTDWYVAEEQGQPKHPDNQIKLF